MKHDGIIEISIGHSANSKVWKNTSLKWSDFVAKIKNPHTADIKLADYHKLQKVDQAVIKDKGGYVGGMLKGNSRKKGNVLSRSLLTLDADFATYDLWWDFTLLYSCAAVIHSTFKHTDNKPRFRLIIPLDREVTADEYDAISRKVAGDLNIDLFDQTTFEANRLMFWPVKPNDVEFYCEVSEGDWLSADAVLSTYSDWTDIEERPRATSCEDRFRLEIKNQEDPETKKGIIGIFCRAYSISEAIEELIPDEYEMVSDGRYTYKNGTSAGGMLVYEDKFSYSYHDTDPTCERLCNAFDLVRIHKFGHLDNAKGDGKNSLRAMEEFASKDKKTKLQIANETINNAKVDFSDARDDDYDELIGDEFDEAEDISWMTELEANTKGEYLSSAINLTMILANDKNIKRVFALNEFDNRKYVLTDRLPWRKVQIDNNNLKDVDYSGLRNYLECKYGIVAVGKIDDIMQIEVDKNSFHPIRNYLNSLKWDGNKRIDTLLIDYFGAEDTLYTRAAIRKMLCGAVARALCPGTKFDLVLTLVGSQGTYKSTFIRKLGVKWFSDSFFTVQGKEAFEQIQGAWIVEMAELAGLRKAEVENIKHFISKCEDSFRPAYGREMINNKRQCVFFGTTNNDQFLKDATGNRRFMPINVREQFITKSVINDLTESEIDQIWAEALDMYAKGEKLYLSEDENDQANDVRSNNTERDDRVGIIEEYLNKLVPENWDELDLEDRIKFLDNPLAKGTKQIETTCAIQIWCECFGKSKNDYTRAVSYEMNNMLNSIHSFSRSDKQIRHNIYGKQRGFERKRKNS